MKHEEQQLLPSSLGGLVGNNPAANAGNVGSIPAARRSHTGRKCGARGPRALPCNKTRHQNAAPRHLREEKSCAELSTTWGNPWAAGRPSTVLFRSGVSGSLRPQGL